MAQTIKLKRSATSGNVPTTAQLELGELAINTFDGKIYIKKNDGTASVVEVGSAPSGYNNTNWDTAYNWGNHADAGYLTSYTDTNTTYSAGAGLTLSGTEFSVSTESIATHQVDLSGTNPVVTFNDTSPDPDTASMIKTINGRFLFMGKESSELWHNGSQKLKTTDAGVTVTGALDFNSVTGRAITITGDSGLDGADTSIYLGNAPTSYGFDITYEGSGSGNSNAFVIKSTNINDPKELFRSNQDGIVNLPQSGAKVAGNVIYHEGNLTPYVHPTHPGDDLSVDTGALTGATVISDLDFNVTTDTLGHVTDANASVSTRTLTAANIGAAPASHTHDYVSEGGVSFNGEYPLAVRTSANTIYSDANIRFRGSDSRLSVDGNILIGGNNAFHDGYHPNADKWTTARTITLGGDLTGSVSIDGSANVTLSAQVANNSHSHNYIYGDSQSNAPSTALQYLNTYGNSDDSPSDDYYNTLRMGHGNPNTYYNNTLAVKMTGSGVGGLWGRTTTNGSKGSWRRFFADDYHPNADKWTTARSHTVTLSGDVTGTATQSVDGTGNKTWSITTAVGNDSHTHSNYMPVYRTVSSSSDTFGTYILAKDDGGFTGSRPSGSHNGVGMLTMHTHTGNYYSQLALDTSQNMLHIRSANNSSSFGGWSKIWSSTNDGSGSGLDADLLDGQHGSYYYSAGNPPPLTADPTLTLTGDVTGSATFTNLGNATLTATVANDSHSHSNYLPISGKAADSNLLDGRDSTNYGATLATYGTTAGSSGRIRITAPFNTNSGKMFQVTVSVYSGYTCHEYVVSAYLYSTTNQWYVPKVVYSGTGSPDIVVGRDSSGKAYISIANDAYTGVRVHNMTRGYNTSVADTYAPWTITINGATENSVTPSVYKTWNSGNDGSGSGLDADLLDGQQGSYYAPLSSIPSVGNGVLTINTTGSASGGGTFSANQSGNTTITINATDTNTTYNFAGSSFTSRNSGNVVNVASATSNTIGYCNGSNSAGFADGGLFVAAHSTSWVSQIFSNFRNGELSSRGKNSGTWQSWRTQWSSGNDGSGSGLDADLLDGNDSSYFYSPSNVGPANSVNSTGHGSGNYTWRQSSGTFDVYSGWHSYLINNHGNGATYYNQIIAMPFWGAPRYSRLEGGTQRGPYTFWTTENDGAGSGLDADLLDGYEGSRYTAVRSTDAVAGDWNSIFSTGNGYTTGFYQVENIGSASHSNEPTGVYTYGGVLAYRHKNSTLKMYASHTGDLAYQTGWNNDSYSGWRKILNTGYYGDAWTSNNDGSGSGLDADTVDGYHAGDIVLDMGTARIANMNSLGSQSAKYSWNNVTTGRPAASQSNEYGVLLHLDYDSGNAYQQAWDISQSNLYVRTLNYSTDSGSWHKVYHSGNDGSGSGLDADLLDGLHSTAFLRATGGTVSGNLAVTGNLTTQNGWVDAKNAVKINGTTVIDSSRNLTNVGTISASGSSQILGELNIRENASAPGYTFLRFQSYSTGGTLGSVYRQYGTMYYSTSSDYRLKENVVPLLSAVDRVNALKPKRFNFIEYKDQTIDGFIAHEVQEVIPEAVVGEKDAVDSYGKPIHQAIDHAKIVPLLTAGLQEALAEIEKLKARLSALEN